MPDEYNIYTEKHLVSDSKLQLSHLLVRQLIRYQKNTRISGINDCDIGVDKVE